MIIPPLKDENDMTKALNLIDGLLIPGGDDIDPKYFKEDPHPSVVLIDPEIIEFQMGFFNKALNKGIPVFGICAGLQIINIACGGNIYQDIPSQYSNPIKHKKNGNEKKDPFHNVKIEENSKLYNILQKGEVSVNSTHHQALKDVAEGFMVTARSEDGIIEAIESRKHRFVIGVQWHPEDLYRRNNLFLKLFERLVSECGQGVSPPGSI